jgi:hypothetical protein
MDDFDQSGLRHRGVAQQPKTDSNNNTTTSEGETELVYPAAPPNSPVDALPVNREYVIAIDPKTGEDIFIWNSPPIPYLDGVEVIEQKSSEPVTLGTIVSDALIPLNVISILAYVGVLFGNAKFKSPSFMFAMGQLNENSKSFTLTLVKFP